MERTAGENRTQSHSLEDRYKRLFSLLSEVPMVATGQDHTEEKSQVEGPLRAWSTPNAESELFFMVYEEDEELGYSSQITAFWRGEDGAQAYCHLKRNKLDSEQIARLEELAALYVSQLV